MCAYKLVTIKFKWWGLQNKVENFIQKVSASPLQGCCWGGGVGGGQVSRQGGSVLMWEFLRRNSGEVSCCSQSSNFCSFLQQVQAFVS